MDRIGTWAWVCTALVLGGCLGAVVPAADAPPGASRSAFRPVVALLDTGINPYHEAFGADAGWGGVDLAALGIDATPLARPEGDVDARLAGGEPLWPDAKTRTLYSFPGTRVLAMSFATELGDAPPVQDAMGHGTAVASVVARDAPDALVVMLQLDRDFCWNATCLMTPAAADALAWAAAQPWIDVVSFSVGLPFEAYDPAPLHPEAAAFVRAGRMAHDSGKLLVASAGNDPALSTTDYFSGPPWVVSVGGAEPGARGETAGASRAVDVVANYTETVARHDGTTETTTMRGTSFAAPVVAASLAQALHLARRDAAWDAVDARVALRDALNATAVPWDLSDWRPALPQEPRGLLRTPLPVLAAGPQAGWGYVDAGLAPRIAEAALAAEAPAPGPTATWQAQYQALRERVWT